MCDLDNLKSKKCRACGREKLLKFFYKSSNLKNGYLARCKICYNSKVTSIKKDKGTQKFPKDAYSLTGIAEKDYKLMYYMLKSIGYSLDRDIHEQFCEKYNLNIKKREQRSLNKFTPKDFNL